MFDRGVSVETRGGYDLHDVREIRMPRRVLHDPLADMIEKNDKSDDKFEEEVIGKWQKSSKGLIKCKGWKSNRGYPVHVKSGPGNKHSSFGRKTIRSSFGKSGKGWGAPWR